MDLVVGDEPSCRDAAVALGKRFYSHNSNDSTFQAGCFSFTTEPRLLNFNQKIDPSSTSPLSVTVGICRPVPGIVVNDHRV